MRIQFLSRTAPTILAVGLVACSEPQTQSVNNPASVQSNESAMSENTDVSTVATNPFFEASPLILNYPQFDLIQTVHYLPAFEQGMAEQLAEIEAIANHGEDPDFENTIIALELSGQLLDRVSRVFFSMSSAHTNDEIRSLQQQLAPQLAAHRDAILLNPALFARIQTLFDQRLELPLEPEALRLSLIHI